MTNARGVVQFTGLSAGEYRLRSEKAPWSRVVVPLIATRDGEAVVYPRPIRHVPHASMHLTLTPAKQESGEGWVVELLEAGPTTGDSNRVTRTATGEGELTLRHLPAGLYRLSVRTTDGAVIEETALDLSRGGDASLALSLEEIRVRGTLLIGDEPLRAHIRFTNGTGKSVGVSSDEDGAFTTTFPGAGEWSTVVLTGPARNVRLNGPRVEIPKERDGTPVLEIRLPGGRLRGTVLNASGEKTQAAVHAMRERRIVAQQVTDEGAFDFIGLKDGTYTIDAQAAEGFAQARSVDVAKDETTDVTLTVESYEEINLVVRTPHGTPATGATVEVSMDGGVTWSDRVTNVHGRLRLKLPRGTNAIELLVNTAAYPSRLIRLPITAATKSRDIDLVLSPAGGRLGVAGNAYIITSDTRAPFFIFIRRGLQMGHGDTSAFLEPGNYHVCRGPQIEKTCRRVTVAPGSSVFVDLQADASEPKK